MLFVLDGVVGSLWVYADDFRVLLMSRKAQGYKMLYLRDRVRTPGPSQFVDIEANYDEFT